MEEATMQLEENNKQIMIENAKEKLRFAEERVFFLRNSGCDIFFAERIFGTYVSYGINKNDLQTILSWKEKKNWMAIGDNIFVVFNNGKVAVFSKGKGYYIENSKYGQWKDISKIAVSDSFYETIVYGITNDGRVRVHHISKNNRSTQDWFYYDVEEWNHIDKIRCTADDVFGIKKDGTVVGSGYVSCRALKEWTNVEDIYRVPGGVIGLMKDGTIICDGIHNYAKEICDWDEIVKISFGDLHILGLKADGTVVCIKSDNVNLDIRCCEVSQWKNIVDIWAGDNVSIGLREDGTIVSCGKEFEKYRTKICFNVSNFNDEYNMYKKLVELSEQRNLKKDEKEQLLDEFDEVDGKKKFGKKDFVNEKQKRIREEIEKLTMEIADIENEIAKVDREFEQLIIPVKN